MPRRNLATNFRRFIAQPVRTLHTAPTTPQLPLRQISLTQQGAGHRDWCALESSAMRRSPRHHRHVHRGKTQTETFQTHGHRHNRDHERGPSSVQALRGFTSKRRWGLPPFTAHPQHPSAALYIIIIITVTITVMLTCGTETGTAHGFCDFLTPLLVTLWLQAFLLCALSVLWSSVGFCDRFVGLSKTIVRVSSIMLLLSLFLLQLLFHTGL